MSRRPPATIEQARAALAGGWPDTASTDPSPFGAGLINDTFAVDTDAGRFVLQRVHPVFSPQIHHNIVAVTDALERAGLGTPRLVPTATDEPWHEDDAGVWRLQTRACGHSVDAIDSPARAEAAGRFLARFHGALADLDHEFVGMRAGVHDTAAHLATLRAAVDEHRGHRLHAEVAELAAAIEARAATLPALTSLPERIVHGDPKLNNFLFDDADHVHCLVDLDTVGPMPLPLELGDAWRSWCNPAGEDDTRGRFDLDTFDASVRGYAAGNSLDLQAAERDALVYGVEWITLELSARFAADALREAYFGWDAGKYAGAGEHNLVRARGQWALHEAAVAVREPRARTLRRELG